MEKATICVTGATGGLGSRVLHHLLHTVKVAPSDVIISTANTKAATLPLDVRVRHGDYLDPASLAVSFTGISKLLLVSYPSIAHEIRVKAHVNAIDAAIYCGVQHIYYTSLAFSTGSKAAVMQAHRDTERYLKETCEITGVKYTVIREGIYSESYPLYLGYLDLLEAATDDGNSRAVILPRGSRVGIAWVAKDDLGEGTARIMADSTGAFDDKVVLLSGAKAISIVEVAQMISNIWSWQDRPLTVEEVEEKAFVEYQMKRKTGLAESDDQVLDMVTRWATSYAAIEQGELAVVDPLLQEVLERELKPLQQTLMEDYNRSRQILRN